MNGNITKEGIKLDLEWMHRVGLGGFQVFDANLTTPQVVDKRLAYMTPDWNDAFRYAITLGDKLGLEETIASSPGWSETGGPWVPPPQGMKKYVWSETSVEGGEPFIGKLAHPPSNTGAFQNMGIRDPGGALQDAAVIPEFYADAAVVAFRRPASDVPVELLNPKVTTSGDGVDVAMLSDGDFEKTAKLPIPSIGETAWIQYEFPKPQTIRSLTLVMNEVDWFTAMATKVPAPEKSLEASDDGSNFRVVVKIPDHSAAGNTVSFLPVQARFFRVTFKRTPTLPIPNWAAKIGFNDLDPAASGVKIGPPPTDYEIAEIILSPGARCNQFELKAGFQPDGDDLTDLYQFASPTFAKDDVVARADVINLTDKMRADGTLDWIPPAGKWVVLRFGFSLLGITNHPATAEATGLEVDKLSHAQVKSYMDAYLDSYKKALGSEYIGEHGIQYVVTDSWEAGSQNWTDDMIDQFTKRRGYDPLPWLPVLAGRVVESAEASDQFLWDFRKTIADLIADEHYGQIQASLKERSLGHYGESHEVGRAFIADGMEVKKLDDIPMGAMWTQRPGIYTENYDNNADDRESASVAHIYGQNIAAAESMTAATSAWAWSPATLKPTADAEFLNGINRLVIHESAHQPLIDKAPGLTLGPFGQWFNRNETWAEQARPWVEYLSRCSFLLQQGRFSADLAYFYGEDSNLTEIFQDKTPDIPDGYGFDYINADGVIHELNVVDGRIRTKSGMSYRVLGLDPYSRHMSLPVLRAIHKLVAAGAVVAGPKPTDDPSLADDRSEFRRLADELFGDGTGVHVFGNGTVYAGFRLADALAALNIAPDFDYTKCESDTRLRFVHRKLADGDLYFVANRNNRDETVEARFRVTGKAPELWHAETGKTEPVSFNILADSTALPLHLEPWGTVFVMFRHATKETSLTLPKVVETPLATIDGSWQLSFQSDRGAPPSITLDKLSSWCDHPDRGVKYFSGSCTYTTTVEAPADWFKPGVNLWIDLGEVMNLAEVTVNGQPLGIVWHAPFRLDVTGAMKAGANEITVKVTNAWVNRLIGDQQPDAQTKYTFTTAKPYKAESPLLPSGLLGPVKILSSTMH